MDFQFLNLCDNDNKKYQQKLEQILKQIPKYSTKKNKNA